MSQGQQQMTLVQTHCQDQEVCKIEASRKFFGDDSCPGSTDANMVMWLIYSCKGGRDLTASYDPICDGGGDNCVDLGHKHHIKVPGCSGKANLICEGGSISIYKVTSQTTPIFVFCIRHCIVANGTVDQMKIT